MLVILDIHKPATRDNVSLLHTESQWKVSQLFFFQKSFLQNSHQDRKSDMSSNVSDSTANETLLPLKCYVCLHSVCLTLVYNSFTVIAIVPSSPQGVCQKTAEEQRSAPAMYSFKN